MEIEYSHECMVIDDEPYLTTTDFENFKDFNMRARCALVTLEENNGGFTEELSSVDDELRVIHHGLQEIIRLQRILSSLKDDS